MTLAKLAAAVAVCAIWTPTPAIADSGAVQLLQPSLPDTPARDEVFLSALANAGIRVVDVPEAIAGGRKCAPSWPLDIAPLRQSSKGKKQRRIVVNMGTKRGAAGRDRRDRQRQRQAPAYRPEPWASGLSTKLAEVGRPLVHSAVDQIEKGARRVDVDDLLALAVALGVSPVTLLMPAVDSVRPQAHVTASAVPGPVTAEHLWGWLTAKYPLGDMSRLAFAGRAWPVWEQQNLVKRCPAVGLILLNGRHWTPAHATGRQSAYARP